MQKLLTLLVLRYVARSVQGLLDFITTLDKAIDAYIAQAEADLTDINVQIAKLEDNRFAVQKDLNAAESLKAALPAKR